MNNKGFNLTEIIGAMIIISILTVVAGFTVTGVIHRARVDAVTADLQVFASDIEAVLEDIGVFDMNSNTAIKDSQAKIKFKEFLNTVEADYTHTTFEKDKIEYISATGQFSTLAKELIDPWGSNYKLIYNAKTNPGTCILASAGADMVFTDDTYSLGDFKDDILVIISPKY